MSQQTKFKQMDINELTITEQLLFTLESIRDKENPTILEAKKNYAIMGAALADLFNLKKSGLVNNKIVIKDNKKTDYEYINDLIDKLDSLEKKKLIIDVIFGYQYKGKSIENELLDELIKKGLLIEKRNILPIIGPKEIHVSKNALINLAEDRVVNALSIGSKPEKELIYVLAILDAIDLLPYFIDSKAEIEEKKERLNELMEKENLVKQIHKAIKNEPDPESLAMYEEYPMNTMGGIL